MDERLTVAPAAAFLEVHPETLRRLERKGAIKAQRNYLGYRIFALEDLLRFKKKRQKLNDPAQPQ